MTTLAAALYLAVAAYGLALPVVHAGLPVLGQSAFVAVGAVGTALLGPGGLGLPLGLACLLAVGAAGLAGWLAALGVSRVQGSLLGLATWALAWLVDRTLRAVPEVFGGEQGLVRRSPARLVSPTLGLELTLTPAVHVGLAGVLVLLCAAGLARLLRGPAALDLAALRAGPGLAASLGVPVAARRRTVVAVGALLGGVGGCGTTVLLGLVAPADVGPLLSVQLFVAVLVGGRRWWGPGAGVALLVLLPVPLDALTTALGLDPERSAGVATALLLVGVLALRHLRPEARGPGPAGPGHAGPEPGGALSPTAGTTPAVEGACAGGAPRPPWRPVLLQARDVHVSFGALRALDGVDLVVRAGTVHAVVGPNGSGKTTLLRVLAGEQPADGTVEVAGLAVAADPVARVRAGVVRTPQRTVLLPGLGPHAQVALGARGGSRRSGELLRHLLGTPRGRLLAQARARRVRVALAEAGLPSSGSGSARLLQIARSRATGASVLLLDEPAAGMSTAERRHLVSVLRGLAGAGTAVVLVEHDMALVARVADRVTVLAGGRVLAQGPPARVREDVRVQAAYLGTEPAVALLAPAGPYKVTDALL